MHKNRNDAVGNYCIYAIYIDFKTFKIGKADLDRTNKAGTPVRIMQQTNIFKRIVSIQHVDFKIILRLYAVTSADVKRKEQEEIEKYYNETGEIPEGNRNSFDTKNNR